MNLEKSKRLIVWESKRLIVWDGESISLGKAIADACIYTRLSHYLSLIYHAPYIPQQVNKIQTNNWCI